MFLSVACFYQEPSSDAPAERISIRYTNTFQDCAYHYSMHQDDSVTDTPIGWTNLIDTLERKRSIAAILYLRHNGRVKEITIREDVFPNPQQTESQLSRLKNIGLMDFERAEVEGTRRSAKYWSLTPRGEAVARMLEIMELCAEGGISPDRVIEVCDALKEEAPGGPGAV